MDALIPALVAVLLAEFGGKNQAIAHRAAVSGLTPARVMSALLAISIVGLGLAAWGGTWIAKMLTPDARLLLAALALLFAGLPMLLSRRAAKETEHRSFLPAFAGAQLGDSAQFIVFALAARGDQPVLAASGGVAGVAISALPPLLLAKDWPGAVPVRILRSVAATLLIVAGFVLAVQALRLV